MHEEGVKMIKQIEPVSGNYVVFVYPWNFVFTSCVTACIAT